MIVEKLTVERAKAFLEDNGHKVFEKDRLLVLTIGTQVSDYELESIEHSMELEKYLRQSAVHQLAHKIMDTPGLMYEVDNKRDPYESTKKFQLSLCFVIPNLYKPGPVFVKAKYPASDV